MLGAAGADAGDVRSVEPARSFVLDERLGEPR